MLKVNFHLTFAIKPFLCDIPDNVRDTHNLYNRQLLYPINCGQQESQKHIDNTFYLQMNLTRLGKNFNNDVPFKLAIICN